MALVGFIALVGLMALVALEDLKPGWRCLVNTDTATRLRTETLHRSRGDMPANVIRNQIQFCLFKYTIYE